MSLANHKHTTNGLPSFSDGSPFDSLSQAAQQPQCSSSAALRALALAE